MRRFIIACALSGVAAAQLLATAPAGMQAAPQSDLDAFMKQVLARRDDNWKKLQQYVLDEREEIDLRGPAGTTVWGERREYTWYIRDGFFVRSPLVFNGVAIGEAERRQYETDYLRRQQERDARRREQKSDDAPQDLDSFIRQSRDPQFISSAYFLRFRFEDGKYALVGREPIEGREALRIEYYPSALFAAPRRRDREQRSVELANELATRRLMNQGSLVTLWVDPEQHQILKYTLDNFAADLVPAQWLGRLTGLHATMSMGQPFPDVWLPRSLEMRLALALAIGPFDFRYALDYHDYRRADVSSVIRIPDR